MIPGTDIELDEQSEVHVAPVFGREHIFNGTECWCHPERDVECDQLVIHNVEN